MPSRRRRKRGRRPTHAPGSGGDGRRGDRGGPPPGDFGKYPGGLGGPFGHWAEATPADLLLVRRAIREDWPVPDGRGGQILEAVFSRVDRGDIEPRWVNALCRLALAANRHQLDQELGRPRRAGRRFGVEECLALDAAQWAGEARSGVCHWPTGASVGYHFDPARSAVWLSYTVTLTGRGAQEPEPVAYFVRLASAPAGRGGVRRRLVCPLVVNGVACNRRVKRLYAPPGQRYFGCRWCHRLTYASRQASRKPAPRREAGGPSLDRHEAHPRGN